MSAAKDTYKALTCAFAAMLSMLLAACGSEPEAPPPPKPKHVHRKPPPVPLIEQAIEYEPDAYLLHLSLAELSLEASPADVPAIGADLEIARVYTRQKQSESALQPVIILEYALKDQNDHRRIAIPFLMPDETGDFLNLKEAMERLNSLSYTMYDLRPAVVKLPQQLPLEDEGSTAQAAETLISGRLQPLLRKALPISPMERARVELRLTRFFMRYKYREPAYLAIENAKHSLAAVDETSGDPDITRNLSKEIDAQESLLYKTMPFTFNF